MQITCPNCKHATQVDDAKIPEKATSVQCHKCGVRFPFNNKTSATSLSHAEKRVHCPKCNAEQEQDKICQHCGLVFEKYLNSEATASRQALPEGWSGGYQTSDRSFEMSSGQQIAPVPPVSIGKYLWIFAALYIGLMIVAAIALSQLKIERGSGINTGVFIGAVIFSLSFFLKDHGRLWDAQEKRRLIIGLLLVSSAYDLLLSFFVFQRASDILTILFATVFAITFVTFLRLLGLWFFMGPMAEKIFGRSIASNT